MCPTFSCHATAPRAWSTSPCFLSCRDAGIPLTLVEVPGLGNVAALSQSVLPPWHWNKCPATLLLCTVVAILSYRLVSLRKQSPPTGNTSLETRGAPFSLRVGFAHHTGDLRYTPLRPPPASLCGECTACLEAQGAQQNQSHNTVWNSWWNPTILRPELNLGQHSCTEATSVTAPPLPLTSAGCPSEWLSAPAQPCSLLRLSHLEEPQPPSRNSGLFCLVFQCLWVLKNRYQ